MEKQSSARTFAEVVSKKLRDGRQLSLLFMPDWRPRLSRSDERAVEGDPTCLSLPFYLLLSLMSRGAVAQHVSRAGCKGAEVACQCQLVPGLLCIDEEM